MMEESIADSVRKCLDKFCTIRKAVSPEAVTLDKKTALGIGEEEARFKVWSANIGAHSAGRRSLQYRLRDASHLQKQVTSLLNELSQLLEDAFLIMSGSKVPWDCVEGDGTIPLDINSDSDSDYDEIPDTEMAQIVHDVSDVVNCLLRLSVAIRNPAPHDRFATFVSVETSHYEPFEIQHVKTKFDGIEPFLADRFGRATSRRRQYFKYRESHHLKLKQGLDLAEQNDVESTIASSLPRHAKAAGFDLGAMDEDEASDSGLTQTSLASSREGSGKLCVPPLPKEAEGGPFECPFCYMMIIATSKTSWRRHVLADLRPYICLWEDCTVSDKEFVRRHDWILHEIQNHRRTYNCPCSCGKVFPARSRCREHVIRLHPDAFPKSQLESMIDLGAQIMESDEGISCPLCKEDLHSMKDYQRHVGRHQEQLALFALPSLQTNNDAEMEDNDSGTYSGASSEDLNTTIQEGIASQEEDKNLEQTQPLKSILKQPKDSFPEDPNPIREGVAPHKDDKKAK
ncbi:unnamed protein product [Fusarium langsethiae]|nr:unnamed protein product [Fusarium langsethiae]